MEAYRLRPFEAGRVEGRRLATARRAGGRSAPPRGSDRAELIVAIDGGVATGKSAVGKRVAERLSLPFIDSGLMYRAATRLAAEQGMDPADAAAGGRLAETVRVTIDSAPEGADGKGPTGGNSH